MCVVSMVGDHYRDEWPQKYPWISPSVPFMPMAPPAVPNSDRTLPMPQVSPTEFEKLKRDVEEMKKLLKRAKEYDEKNGEPDCEIDDKMAFLKKVAQLVGIDLDDVLGKKPDVLTKAARRTRAKGKSISR